MHAFRLLAVVLALAVYSQAPSQTGERGSVPPGQSRDGAAPADGAIKGGAILPGETGGRPHKDRRCEQLAGSLREDCLKEQREAAATGATKPVDILQPSDAPKRAP
jgi:hypothetical protein